jgi:hypothetical protein
VWYFRRLRLTRGEVRHRRRRAFAVGTSACGLCAGAALAAATPISPPPGSVVRTSRPTLAWTLPASEQAAAIYVASRPATNAAGKLLDRNLVAGSVLHDPTATAWTPARRLYEGTYWWSVRTVETTTQATRYGAPVSFTIPPYLRASAVAGRGRAPHTLVISIRHRSNLRRLTTRVEVRLRGRLVWWRTIREAFPAVDRLVALGVVARLPRGVSSGDRLTLTARVAGSGLVSGSTRALRAP